MTTPFPDVARIEPIGACNLHCQHCPTGIRPNGRKRLSLEKFKAIIRSLPFLPRVLVLYHGGEPLLNWDIEKMVSYAKQRGVWKVVLNTNGTALDNADLFGLDEMRVSLDGASVEECEAIRRGMRFDEVVDNVLEFIGINPKCKVVIYNVRINSDGTTPAFIADRFAGYPVEFRNEKMRSWAIHGETIDSSVRYCTNLFETLTVMSDDRVVQCCEDITGDDVIGSLDDNTPLELWESMEPRRAAFASGDYPKLCKSCHIVTGSYL